MDANNRLTRYTAIVRKEVESGALRGPVWAAALGEAKGDAEAATDYYVRLRVSHMMEIEEQNQKADKVLSRLRKFYDSIPGAPGFTS